ncbi:spore germination protein [Synechococcales cyanobacterium C]|uniref:Spore germination protein n=1 Tax=Petrachloros mirabilis ULC683 TaxID=2781853 RepID=A0A8K1ZXQ4_9CYAN|nr:GerMN domain-containing protein [Petrachloros mirabilis]NCJ05813.1 spore germination protein [Petrachloros mirabilis ULC683]
MTQSNSNPRQVLFKLLGALVLATSLLGLAACEPEPPPEPPVTPVEPGVTPPEVEDPPEDPSTQDPAPQNQVSVFWLRYTEESAELMPAAITLDSPALTEAEQLRAAIDRLLQGPANADVSSEIPNGTQLRAIRVETDGVHVDLSSEFTSGGGSASMQGRLAQIIYTASALDPDEPVWLSIDGEPLTVLGGEGLVIDQPTTRQLFQENFSL